MAQVGGLIGDWFARWHARRARRQMEAGAQAFWRWFATVSDDTRHLVRTGLAPGPGGLSTALARRVEELNRQSQQYHPHVRVAVGGAAEVPELVLTADGDPRGADAVRALARGAPHMSGWTIRTFKPRLGIEGFVSRVGSIALRSDDVEFATIEFDNPETGTCFLLVLFIPGVDGAHASEVRVAADQLFQSAFGEERMLIWSEWIWTVDTGQVPEKLKDIPRTPFSEIEDILEPLDRRLGPSVP